MGRGSTSNQRVEWLEASRAIVHDLRMLEDYDEADESVRGAEASARQAFEGVVARLGTLRNRIFEVQDLPGHPDRLPEEVDVIHRLPVEVEFLYKKLRELESHFERIWKTITRRKLVRQMRRRAENALEADEDLVRVTQQILATRREWRREGVGLVDARILEQANPINQVLGERRITVPLSIDGLAGNRETHRELEGIAREVNKGLDELDERVAPWQAALAESLVRGEDAVRQVVEHRVAELGSDVHFTVMDELAWNDVQGVAGLLGSMSERAACGLLRRIAREGEGFIPVMSYWMGARSGRWSDRKGIDELEIPPVDLAPEVRARDEWNGGSGDAGTRAAALEPGEIIDITMERIRQEPAMAMRLMWAITFYDEDTAERARELKRILEGETPRTEMSEAQAGEVRSLAVKLPQSLVRADPEMFGNYVGEMRAHIRDPYGFHANDSRDWRNQERKEEARALARSLSRGIEPEDLERMFNAMSEGIGEADSERISDIGWNRNRVFHMARSLVVPNNEEDRPFLPHWPEDVGEVREAAIRFMVRWVAAGVRAWEAGEVAELRALPAVERTMLDLAEGLSPEGPPISSVDPADLDTLLASRSEECRRLAIERLVPRVGQVSAQRVPEGPRPPGPTRTHGGSGAKDACTP